MKFCENVSVLMSLVPEIPIKSVPKPEEEAASAPIPQRRVTPSETSSAFGFFGRFMVRRLLTVFTNFLKEFVR